MTQARDVSASSRSRAVVVVDESERVLGALLEHMTEHAAVTLTEAGAVLESPFGTVSIARFADQVSIEATAQSPEILALIQHFIAEHLAEFTGEEVAVEWSGAMVAPAPARFRVARVSRVFDVTPKMRRVVFACEDPALDAEGAGYHLRLLLPPEGRAPRWPQLRADGKLDWPQGEDALTTRVYTIRAAEAGTISVDFALHEGAGSPGADFARKALPGDRVGLLGPGGDGLPQARRLLLLGDESALPAIARMLAEAAPETEAEVYLEISDAREEQHLRSLAPARIVWLHRGEAAPGLSGLLEAALEARLAKGGLDDLFIWAGCERAVATRMRKILAAAAPESKKRSQIYAYWERRAAGSEAV